MHRPFNKLCDRITEQKVFSGNERTSNIEHVFNKSKSTVIVGFFKNRTTKKTNT